MLIVLKLMTWLATGLSTQHNFLTAAYLIIHFKSARLSIVYLSSLGVGIMAQINCTEGSVESLIVFT